jgi:hypothetical protein
MTCDVNSHWDTGSVDVAETRLAQMRSTTPPQNTIFRHHHCVPVAARHMLHLLPLEFFRRDFDG